ncbi:hypothetical protein QFZ97_002476 [Paraburkholderia youngii]
MIGHTLVGRYTMRWLMLTPSRTAGENRENCKALVASRKDRKGNFHHVNGDECIGPIAYQASPGDSPVCVDEAE